MEHYVIFLLPLLMIADYYLTLFGASMYKKAYGNYLVVENFEINPIWQESVNKPEKFDFRYPLMSIVFTALFIAIDTYDVINDNIFQGILGYYIVLYSVINAGHLDRIFLFKYAYTHPGLLKGKVFISYEMSVKMSQYRLVFLFIPLSIIAFYTKSYFAWGGALSVIGAYLTHSGWIKWHRQNNAGAENEVNK